MREEGAVPGLSPENSQTLLTYVADMEIGANISPRARMDENEIALPRGESDQVEVFWGFARRL